VARALASGVEFRYGERSRIRQLKSSAAGIPRTGSFATMGVTIARRGRLADLTRVEEFEDRLVDCALEMGALVQIWRTWPDDRPERVVRGVILISKQNLRQQERLQRALDERRSRGLDIASELGKLRSEHREDDG
jgi:hypothetical protein